MASRPGRAYLIALAPDDSYIVVGNGTTWVRETGSTARTSLGLGTGDTPTFANVNSSGYYTAHLLEKSLELTRWRRVPVRI